MSFPDPLCFALPGEKHRVARTPGQDAVAEAGASGLFAAALADGVGSLPDSHHGARAATSAAVAAAVADHHRYPDLLHLSRHALIEATRAVQELAAEHETTPDRLACTLTVLLIDGRRVQLAVVGDGTCAVRHADATLELVLSDPNKEFANFTDSLTTSDLTEVARFAGYPIDALDGVLLSSDGFEPLLGRGPTYAQRPTEFVNALLDAPRLQGWSVEEFSRMGRSAAITTHTDDDLSLIVAALRGGHAGRALELGQGGRVHLREPVRWPTGHRAWHAAERGGLVVVDVPELAERDPAALVADVPPPIDGSCLAWPLDVAQGPGVNCGLLVRPWGSTLLDTAANAAQVQDCVRGLHDAGRAHGRLTAGAFAVDRYGRVQLRDCIPALFDERIDERRRADERFLLGLAASRKLAEVSS